MSTPLAPLITAAGLAAIWRASNDGVSAQITHIALGDGAYAPAQSQTKLRGEQARYPIAGGERLGNTQIHLTAIADDDKAFWVREIGFILADGTLLAVWSDPKAALAYKAADVQLLLAYDLALNALPPDSVTIQSSGAGLNLSLASELAALAAAQISEATRGLERDDRIRAQADKQQALEPQVAALQSQSRALEQEHAADKRAGLELATANAATIVSLQHLFVKQHLGI
ncbi:phage tail protein [Chromobacterium sp. Panama]|uniref:phage tail-collar fiber domain-containing protein n=1 Tax=Chromobacterium sp. Panama TaxID=2161826 RepID=UPI000D31DEEC|nr:phage tail protein [Chromobacterium sp. Panama]PTU67641.1 phage tail protein [Chromobacterium sp. Panama]